MDPTDLLPQLEQLDDNVDDLEEVLQPFLGSSLTKMSKNLPVMDKAKLHVLITYALESLIFSYLRLHGVDAKQHPVFRELTRVKQYFDKIKALETEPEQRTMTLDKAAANRFIKHGLIQPVTNKLGQAGNHKIDLERAEKEAKERARAQLKAVMLAKKAAAAASQEGGTGAAPSTAQSHADSEDSDEEMDDEEAAEQHSQLKQNKKAKNDKAKAPSRGGKKHSRKTTKAELREEKKDRRQKKEDSRKARKAK
ncbi:uncharacterized protein N7482_009457 [Penicillium canariense]|uniref:Exosome complex protein n=1 Tax=Penicillium canariense TaxID=189055 RepID=A0A9W9LFQ9_9EURO|nr:uncharacterized protein N7482_009457 [Penicillium canariense]KAJ5152979.1 hypothetical protein N7482_009457 [Penicillium canariense]